MLFACAVLLMLSLRLGLELLPKLTAWLLAQPGYRIALSIYEHLKNTPYAILNRVSLQ